MCLPDSEGFEVANHIRSEARLSETKIVAATSHDGAKHRQCSLYAGFDGCPVKPTALEDITAAIVRVHQMLQTIGRHAHGNC